MAPSMLIKKIAYSCLSFGSFSLRHKRYADMEKYVIRKVKLYAAKSRISYSYLPFPEMCLFYAFRMFIFVLTATIGQNIELFECKPHHGSVLKCSDIKC
jgi:hypothetical protein